MNARSLAAEVEDFDAKLEEFYSAFKKGKKFFLDETTNDPLRIENDRLRRELKASEDENHYLKEDFQQSQAKNEELQRELDAKETLLATIRGYVSGPSSKSDRKREISPVPDADRERERKRSRDQYSQQPSHLSREDYTRRSSYHDQRNGEARNYERSDSGFVTDSSHYRSGPPSAPASAFKNPQLGHAASPPQHPRHHRSAQDHQPESSNGGISIMGAAQHGAHNKKAANAPHYYKKRPRRIVCHACYAKREICDLGKVCKNCRADGLECKRTLCAAFQTEKGCYRPVGDCFKVHDEQGYLTVDEDPFGNGSASRPA